MKHGPTNTKWLKNYRRGLNLSKIQKEFLVGTLLGDGHIQPSRSGLLARLQVRHAIRFVKYIDWQQKIWEEWTLKKPVFDACNNSVVLRTIFHPELSFWREQFYLNRKKIVPQSIGSLLKTPLSLAVWFMDDGNGSKRGKWLRLSTYAFGLSGNQRLKDCLRENFGLDSKIYHDSKGDYLWFSKSNAYELYKCIKPHILPCMEYKFVSITPKLLTP